MNRPLLTRRTWLASSAVTVAATALRRPAAAQTLDAINVGLGLIESHAEGYYAQELGFFTKHGLNVTLKQLRNGATIAAAVASGDLQTGCSTILQLVQARGRALPFSLIAAGAIHDGRVAHTVGLAVAASSKVTAPKELNGKTVAVSTLNGLDQLIAAVLIDKNGGDSSTLKFVELTPPSMLEALAQGRIDAASMEDPELSAAGKAIRSLGDGEDAIAQRFVTTAWFSNSDWLSEKSVDRAAFRASDLRGRRLGKCQHRQSRRHPAEVSALHRNPHDGALCDAQSPKRDRTARAGRGYLQIRARRRLGTHPRHRLNPRDTPVAG